MFKNGASMRKIRIHIFHRIYLSRYRFLKKGVDEEKRKKKGKRRRDTFVSFVRK